jgi:autoinducer-2 kinase
MAQYVMAVDAGTGSCRAVIFDRAGRQVSIAQHEWVHHSLPDVPGSQVFDTKRNWELISHSIREAMFAKSIRPSEIKAVSASSMREGMVLYDKSGREIWACPNVDSRAGAEAATMIKNGMAKRIFFEGGDWVSITAPPRLLWIQRNKPDVFRAIAHLGMISDWILFRLSGRYVTDPSIGSSSAMFDLKKRDWSHEVTEICGLKDEVLPEVVESGNVIGEVHKNAESQTGLAAGTPVVTGGGDTQLGLLGIGVSDPGRVTVVGGSFWQTTVLMDSARIDRKIRLRTLCDVVPGQWMMEGIGFYCGLTMRWFRDAFCQSEKEEARRHGKDAYAIMEGLAGSVPPGSNGVIGIFANTMNSKRWVHASPSFMQFDISAPDRSGKKECIRAIEESAAYVALGHLDMIESITKKRPSEILMTGGASKGKLWPQIIADVLGVRVGVPVVKESTALGCAIAAGTGAGWYPDMRSAARKLAKVERRLEPSKENHARYEKLYENWVEVYHRALDMVEDGLLNPLWRPTGS